MKEYQIGAKTYRSSQLTHHSDAIVAITGITTIMKQRTGIHFVIGLLMELLQNELLWAVGNADRTS